MSSATKSTVSFDGSLATITIATEGGLNVMSAAAMSRLGEAVESVQGRSGIRFMVIRAEGKVFVAGADIKEMADYDSAQARVFGESGSMVCGRIEALRCITVAAMQGAALGGGCEIALACDFRIATSNVKIGLPELTLGLIPGWGGIPRMARVVGVSMAKRLMFSGAPLTADQCKDVGLIDEVVPDENALDEATQRLREHFVKGGPRAIGLVKRALLDGRDVDAFAECFTEAESREGMGAFVEKRPASWMKG